MNVQELIDELQLIEDKTRIIVQSIDSEGNSIRNTCEFSLGGFEQDSGCSWYGDLKIEVLDEEARKLGYSEEDLGGVPCICFWPIN